jgi:hypothetical protein
MKILKPSLYVAVGMVLGVAVTVVAKPARQQSAARLTETSAGTVNGRPALFVKDAKSGGCWLVVGYGTGDASPSVAVAAPSACQP